MSDLTLYCDALFDSPWVFHAYVALVELGLPFAERAVSLHRREHRQPDYAEPSLTGKVPALVDGDLWLTESLAISEYLAERHPHPAHPRIFPAGVADRARARQVMMWLRTDLFALRAERPTTTIFLGEKPAGPLSEKAAAEAAELVRIASRGVRGDWLFADFCLADVNLALALRRLIANDEPVPDALRAYADRVWARPSVRRFVEHAR